MPIIVDNLTVSYQKRPALHHINCTFKEHEACAIFGPNGAGKSTLLKACMHLLPCETGEVMWQQLKRCDLAYLPQQSEIDRTQPMSVFELVAMGLWYELGLFGGINKQQKERITEALVRVGMADFAHRTIAQLSNGQLQRVLFARMLVQDAQFLLLDEPFNAVDAKTTYALLAVLQECLNQGKAIVAVLHDYEQVRAYFNRTILLAKDKIADGPTNEVLTENNLLQANQRLMSKQDNTWCETP
ncbi:metal ABC transporter ATP-binding protein [Neisseria sp. Ec49-e6-T10]|uniref:metal ABC transporter ATP-binding protein n=1 Tax=Neisseria sp. Ec49-e6-T10 TaxID=3140744 RepID=UPI003EB77F9C